MKIAITSDHAGVGLKKVLKEYLEEKGYQVKDHGPFTEESVDYPDYAKKMCKDVVEGKADFGIGICGTGIGINMACNKVRGIRAALCNTGLQASLARRHNNANVLNMGARIIGDELAKYIVDQFLEAEFEGGRHQRRIDKLESEE